jgi:hypothetical protein
MLCDVFYQMVKEKPEELLTDTAVNVKMSPDIEAKLTDELFPYMGGVDTQRQQVALVPNELSAIDLHMRSALRTKFQGGAYDYALMDQTALDLIVTMESFADIRMLIPAEKLEKWSERFAYARVEGDEQDLVPIAINITGTPLGEACVYPGKGEGGYIYIAFPIVSDRTEVVEPFFDYLMMELLALDD